MLEYSYKTLNIYDDKNYTHYAPNHQKVPGVAYFDKHVQPSKDSQVNDVITSVILIIFRKCMDTGKWKASGELWE